MSISNYRCLNKKFIPSISINLFIVLVALLFLIDSKVAASKITFIVKPTAMPAGDTIYITGSHILIGNWQPDKIPLEPGVDGFWYKTIDFELGTSIEYKITRGKWENEALDADNTIRRNSELTVVGDAKIYIEVPRWKDEIKDARRKVQGQITGTVVYHKNMTGDGVLPRDVIVWLPPDYGKIADKRYPVLYMHDGQQIFDPNTSTHGIDWQIDETITKLIEQHKIREIIVVGAYCTANRSKEYSDGPAGKSYQNFMVNILKPFIDKNYLTLPDRENTSVMGSSMGGIASFLLVWHYPEIYSFAGCFSPAFWLDWEALKKSAFPNPKFPVKIYIDNDGIGLERKLQPGCDLMIEVLIQKGFKLSENLVWYQDLNAGHTEEEWAKRAGMPIEWKYGVQPRPQWLAHLPAPPVAFYAERDKEPPTREQLPNLYVAGIRRLIDSDATPAEFGDIWKLFFNELPILKNRGAFGQPTYLGLGSEKNNDWKFYYTAGIIIDDKNIKLPNNWIIEEIPAADYIKYAHKTGLIIESFNYLFDWYIPKNNLRRLNQPTIEWYHTNDAGAPDFNLPNIYIPIQKSE